MEGGDSPRHLTQSMHWAGSELSVTQLSQIPLVLRREGSAVREVVLEYLRRFKVTPLVSVESASTAGVKEFVRQDNGIGFVERSAVQDELETVL